MISIVATTLTRDTFEKHLDLDARVFQNPPVIPNVRIGVKGTPKSAFSGDGSGGSFTPILTFGMTGRLGMFGVFFFRHPLQPNGEYASKVGNLPLIKCSAPEIPPGPPVSHGFPLKGFRSVLKESCEYIWNLMNVLYFEGYLHSRYTPEIWHRYQTLPFLKGVTFSKPVFWVSMLVLRECICMFAHGDTHAIRFGANPAQPKILEFLCNFLDAFCLRGAWCKAFGVHSLKLT